MRGVNDDEIGALIELAAAEELRLRFIELMPLGVTRENYAARHIDGPAMLTLIEAHGDTAVQSHLFTGKGAAGYHLGRPIDILC